MDDNTAEKTETEVVAPTEKVGISLREKLEEKFDAKDESARVEPAKQSEPVEQNAEVGTQSEPKAAQPEKVVVAPPPDMNKLFSTRLLKITIFCSSTLADGLMKPAMTTSGKHPNWSKPGKKLERFMMP
jgi:hypothetical protein